MVDPLFQFLSSESLLVVHHLCRNLILVIHVGYQTLSTAGQGARSRVSEFDYRVLLLLITGSSRVVLKFVQRGGLQMAV